MSKSDSDGDIGHGVVACSFIAQRDMKARESGGGGDGKGGIERERDGDGDRYHG